MDKYCVLIEHHNNITIVDFKITSSKLYAHAVTLSTRDNTEFLEQLKQDSEEQFLEIDIDPKKNQKTIIQIIWLIQRLRILVDCLLFHSKNHHDDPAKKSMTCH